MSVQTPASDARERVPGRPRKNLRCRIIHRGSACVDVVVAGFGQQLRRSEVDQHGRAVVADHDVIGRYIVMDQLDGAVLATGRCKR